MDRRKFESTFYHYRVFEEVKRYNGRETYRMMFCRKNFDWECNEKVILVTPEKTYIPRDFIQMSAEDYINSQMNKRTLNNWADEMEYMEEDEMEIEEMYKKKTDSLMKDLLFDYVSEFTMMNDIPKPFDDPSCMPRSDRSRFIVPNLHFYVADTKFNWYRKIFMDTDSRICTRSVRFMPTWDEMTFLTQAMRDWKSISFPMGTVHSQEELHSFIEKSEEARKYIKDYHDNSFKKSRWIPEEEMSAASTKMDFRTSLNELTQKKLTYDNFRFWERSRHNIFGEIVVGLMDWPVPRKMDVDLQNDLDYYGPDCTKTPDYVLRDTVRNRIMVIDFAVTTGSSGMAADKKREKYETLRRGLSLDKAAEVSVDPIVWKINTKDEFVLPEYCTDILPVLQSNETLEFLFLMQSRISSMEGYETFRVMSDAEGTESEMDTYKRSEKLSEILEITMFFTDKFQRMRTVDINHSREDKSREAGPIMDLRDTSFYKEMKAFSGGFNSSSSLEYDMNAVKAMMEAIKEDKCTAGLSEVCEFNPDMINIWLDEDTTKSRLIREETYKNPLWKIPKIFKFPTFSTLRNNMPDSFKNTTPNFFRVDKATSDGTVYFFGDIFFSDTVREENQDKEKDYNVDGIGCDEKEDVNIIEELIEFMLQERELTGKEDHPDLDQEQKRVLNPLIESNMWEIIESVGSLMENLCYMEGRKDVFKKEKSMTMMKNFGEYILVLKKGSKITSNKQIRYKVITPKDNVMFKGSQLFHQWVELEQNNEFMVTKWLTISLTDLRHFLRVKEVSMSLLSDTDDKMREQARTVYIKPTSFSKIYATMMLVFLENKRGTSTSSQLNRYLVHSATAFVTNRKKLIQDINSTPCRSRVESYIRILQNRWYRNMISKVLPLWEDRIRNMTSTKTDYDRLVLPSMFDIDKEVEFSVIMNEMYVSNLFDKESGFTDHRMKRIVDKMSEAEMHFERIKKSSESKGVIEDLKEFLSKKDELHTFDRNFVASATLNFFKDNRNKIKAKEAMLLATNSSVDEAMKMTSSLVSGPIVSEAIEFNTKISKVKCFQSLFKEVQKLSSNMIVAMVQSFTTVDAIFTIFPKAQIGGAREILIQAVLLRLMIKYLESMSKAMCNIHEKEMLTNDRRKAEIQSETQSQYKSLVMDNSRKGVSCITTSLNADSSRWSPGFVMENFMYFVEFWEIPEEMKYFLHTVISSFSNKKMLVPEDLKEKWNRKDSDQKEFIESVQFFREEWLSNMSYVVMNSGMGQGMFHFLSSFYHCVMDDEVDRLTNSCMGNLYNVEIRSKTLISSDDKTKLNMFTFNDGPKSAPEALISYIKLIDMSGRLCNIHTNWKKSAMSFVISEFNSLFSIGKKMYWATIKDIYTANSIPDLTAPEEAVVFMLSNIRRCLEHGMYLSTISLMMRLARYQLMRYYRLDDPLINDLMSALKTTRENLPYQLGFVPITMPVETLLYGPQVHMFRKDNSPEMNKFYHNTYTAKPAEEASKMRNVIPFSESSMGKYWFELPTRLDKKLKEVKDDFFDNDLSMTAEAVVKEMDQVCLNVNLPSKDMKMFSKFCKEYFIGMNRKYEFQETMVVHSLIRALQLSRSRGIMYPKSKEYAELSEAMREKQNSLKIMRESKAKGSMKEGTDERIKKTNEDLVVMEKDLVNHMVDLRAYTRLILNIESKDSSLFMYKGLSKIVEMHDKINFNLENRMVRSNRYMHATMRPIRFFLNDITLEAKPNEILNFLFDSVFDFRNTTVNTITEMIRNNPSVQNFDYNKNPFGFISTMMGTVDRPFNTFREYLELNHRSMKFLSVTMISDTPCSGNAYQNIFDLYRTKVSPDYVLDYEESYKEKIMSSLDFLTQMSLRVDRNDQVLLPEETTIEQSDDIVTRAKKLYLMSKGAFVRSSLVNNNKIKYVNRWDKSVRPNVEIKFWNDFNTYCKARVDRNTVHMTIVTNGNLNRYGTSENLMSVIRREIRMFQEKDMDIIFTEQSSYSELYEISYAVRDFQFKVVKQYMNTFWKLTVVVDAEGGPVRATHGSRYYEEYELFRDNYTVDRDEMMKLEIYDEDQELIKMGDLIDNSKTVSNLDMILRNNAMSKEIRMREGQDGAGNTMDSTTVREINRTFSTLNLESTFGSLFGLVRENKFVLEEEDFPELGEGTAQNTELSSSTSSGINPIMESGNMTEETYKTISDAIKNVKKPIGTLANEDDSPATSTLMEYFQFLIKRAVEQEMDIDKTLMKETIQQARRTDTFGAFHNMMLWQIRKSFNFELSNFMVLILYNLILRISVSTMDIMPSNNLRLVLPTRQPTENTIFIRLKHDRAGEIFQAIEEFE